MKMSNYFEVNLEKILKIKIDQFFPGEFYSIPLAYPITVAGDKKKEFVISKKDLLESVVSSLIKKGFFK